MALIRELLGKTPKIGENTFLAETAVIIGDVEMGKDCSIWYNAVIRGDVHYIKLGNKVNVQDNVMLHCTYEKFPLNIGNNVSIGRRRKRRRSGSVSATRINGSIWLQGIVATFPVLQFLQSLYGFMFLSK